MGHDELTATQYLLNDDQGGTLPLHRGSPDRKVPEGVCADFIPLGVGPVIEAR
jgi:hypothetical protein